MRIRLCHPIQLHVARKALDLSCTEPLEVNVNQPFRQLRNSLPKPHLPLPSNVEPSRLGRHGSRDVMRLPQNFAKTKMHRFTLFKSHRVTCNNPKSPPMIMLSPSSTPPGRPPCPLPNQYTGKTPGFIISLSAILQQGSVRYAHPRRQRFQNVS